MGNGRSRSLVLAGFFAVYVLFLYGPLLAITILSFQGPGGGLTFPMNGVSTHWFRSVFQQQAVGDLHGAFARSLILGGLAATLTLLICLPAALAFRRDFAGTTILIRLSAASLIVPSILVGLGIGLLFRVLGRAPAWYSSALGAHLSWTLPFGLLIMLVIFSRFNPAYEEAARDLGAGPWKTIRHVVLPIVAPGLIGAALVAFTLSYDEFERSLMTAGSHNTLPLEIHAMTTTVTTPVLYALGTLTTGISIALVAAGALFFFGLQKRQQARSDHG